MITTNSKPNLMSYIDQVRFGRTDTIEVLCHECFAGLAQFVYRVTRPVIGLTRSKRNKEAAARISRRPTTPGGPVGAARLRDALFIANTVPDCEAHVTSDPDEPRGRDRPLRANEEHR